MKEHSEEVSAWTLAVLTDLARDSFGGSELGDGEKGRWCALQWVWERILGSNDILTLAHIWVEE
jgi:hypothetical protein